MILILAEVGNQVVTDPKVLIWTIVAGIFTSVCGSVVSLINSSRARKDAVDAKQSAAVAKVNSVTAVAHAEETVVQVQAIHKAVNSERELMILKHAKLEEVILNMAKEKAAMIEQLRSAAEGVPSMIKVLLLDDDPAFCEVVKGFLEREMETRFTVETLTDPVPAQKVFMERRHDIYIVDYKLKEVNGLDFIRSLRGAAHMGPFILLSAHVDAELKKKAINEGVQLVGQKDVVIHGDLGRDIRFAILSFLAAQRAKQ